MYVFAALASVITILSSEIEIANTSYIYPCHDVPDMKGKRMIFIFVEPICQCRKETRQWRFMRRLWLSVNPQKLFEWLNNNQHLV